MVVDIVSYMRRLACVKLITSEYLSLISHTLYMGNLYTKHCYN